MSLERHLTISTERLNEDLVGKDEVYAKGKLSNNIIVNGNWTQVDCAEPNIVKFKIR